MPLPEKFKGLKPLSLPYALTIAWCEKYWHEHNKFPPVGAIESKFPELDYQEFMAHKTVQLAFFNRGIDPTPSQDLTQEQIAAIVTVTNWSDRRSMTAKLRSLGIHTTKWNGWKKDKHFRDFLNSQLSLNLDNALDIAHEGLMTAMSKGNVEAIRFFMELTGRIPDQQTVNYKHKVASLIEAVQKHVSPEVMQQIGQEFQRVESGRALTGGMFKQIDI